MKLKNPLPNEAFMEGEIFLNYSTATRDQKARGMVWYKEAHCVASYLATKYNKTLEQVAAIIAVLSPAVNWEQNKADTEALLRNDDARVCTYGKNKEKALKIKHLKIYHAIVDFVGGSKVNAFWRCICRPWGADCAPNVVIDRHILRMVINAEAGTEYLGPKSHYGIIEGCFKRAAFTLNIAPHQLQAIVWLVQRERDSN